jgi:hypothetical protein
MLLSIIFTSLSFIFFFSKKKKKASSIQCHTSYGRYANYDNWNLFKMGLFSCLFDRKHTKQNSKSYVLTWNLKRRVVP